MALPIIGAIGAVLLSLADSFVLRVLTALDLSAATCCGFPGALDCFENLVSASLPGLPAQMLPLPGYMKAGKALTIVFSALLASMVVKGLTDGAYKRFVRKTAEVGTIAFPKEVFGWYQCASLHTGKRRMPRQVWIFLFCLPSRCWSISSLRPQNIPRVPAAGSRGRMPEMRPKFSPLEKTNR